MILLKPECTTYYWKKLHWSEIYDLLLYTHTRLFQILSWNVLRCEPNKINYHFFSPTKLRTNWWCSVFDAVYLGNYFISKEEELPWLNIKTVTALNQHTLDKRGILASMITKSYISYGLRHMYWRVLGWCQGNGIKLNLHQCFNVWEQVKKKYKYTF